MVTSVFGSVVQRMSQRRPLTLGLLWEAYGAPVGALVRRLRPPPPVPLESDDTVIARLAGTGRYLDDILVPRLALRDRRAHGRQAETTIDGATAAG